MRSGVLAVLFAGASLCASSAHAQSTGPDSSVAQVRSVVRAYYYHLAAHDWDALAAYVLSPKILERRDLPADSVRVLKDRERKRVVAHAVGAPGHCPSSASPMLDSAAIRVDGDWADVSVARCDGDKGGVDEFRLYYFEARWRFIFTDLFSGDSEGASK